jgi:hypothetical protein
VTCVLVERHRDVPDNDAVGTNDTLLVSVAATVNEATNRVPHARVAVLIVALSKLENRLPATAFLHLEVNALVEVQFVTGVHANETRGRPTRGAWWSGLNGIVGARARDQASALGALDWMNYDIAHGETRVRRHARAALDFSTRQRLADGLGGAAGQL